MCCDVLCCVVLYFVSFYFVCVVFCVVLAVLCCLPGFKSLLIFYHFLTANHERNKYIKYLTSINSVSEILSFFA